MRLTVSHYYDFGADRSLLGAELLGPEDWDALRIEGEGIFRFPEDHDDWERMVTENDWQCRRAQTVISWLEPLGVRSVASYGVGPALVERWIQRLRPQWCLALTDIAPRTVDRLEAHFPGVEVRRHDFCREEPVDADVHLFNCVDTELPDQMWRDVFRRFGSRSVLFFPCITFGWRVIARELWCRRPGRDPMRAGWWRTKGRIDELAQPTHQVRRLRAGRAGTAWLLEPR